MAHAKIRVCTPPSSSGPGRSPLKAKTGVRFPLGVPGKRSEITERFSFYMPLLEIKIPDEEKNLCEVNLIEINGNKISEVVSEAVVMANEQDAMDEKEIIRY